MICAGAASNIFFSVIGGVLTVVATGAFRWTLKRIRHREFRSVFGTKVSHYKLTYGSLVVQPTIINLTPSEQRERFRRFPFAKLSLPDKSYSAQNVGSGCEIRAAAYVAAALGRSSNISSEVVPDEAVKSKLDLDFLSLGATTNFKTLDIFNNEANLFGIFDDRKSAFVDKQTGDRLCNPSSGSDYGIIIKINPFQFPDRTWICCAGYGESGTSGCAWFLSNKWNHIAGYLPTRDVPFMAVIIVEADRDESAFLYELKVARDNKVFTVYKKEA